MIHQSTIAISIKELLRDSPRQMQMKSHIVWILFLSLMYPKGYLLPNRTVETASILFKGFVEPFYGKGHQMVLYTVTKVILLFFICSATGDVFSCSSEAVASIMQIHFSTFLKYIYFQLYVNLHMTGCIQNW